MRGTSNCPRFGWTPDRIGTVMRASGATVALVAKEARVHRSSVYRWRSGESEPRASRLCGISRACGISISELLLLDGGAA